MVKAQVSSKAVHLDGCHLRLAGEGELGRGVDSETTAPTAACIVLYMDIYLLFLPKQIH